MRREARTVLMVATLLAAAATAMAGIKDTKHDMSSANAGGATYMSTNTDQICVFCHTPHNAAQNIPLWNRDNPLGTTFALYTSSTTFDDKPADNAFTSDSISLFCMSCHDGTTGLGGAVHNDPNGVAITMDADGDLIVGDAKLGTDLRNDHPVNFDVTGADATGIKAVVGNKIDGMPLFKSARGSNTLECGSCHSVHDNTNAPFLRNTMAGSALCLKCHIK
ncbi:hypothetical protein RHDC3_02603 [Rhodocyclaceae bacterium]|nr:hypothetical protein RHDC3_02603 [Rhodocyclaceae bacterium]